VVAACACINKNVGMAWTAAAAYRMLAAAGMSTRKRAGFDMARRNHPVSAGGVAWA